MRVQALPTAVICDVSPREDVFAAPGTVPPRTRIELLRALHAAGLRRVDLGSLDPDGMATDGAGGTATVLEAARGLQGLECTVLVTGREELARALQAGAGRARFRMSVTASHGRVTRGCGREDVLAELAVLVRDAAVAGAAVRVDLDCVFDCPFEGVVPEPDALDWVERVVAVEPGVEIALVDTTGNAAPDQVARVFRSALDSWGTRFAFAARDTYGMGAASVAAAWGQGCRVFDAAAGGIGGAPGVAGTVATEDLAWLFRRMGVETGLDLDALLAAADLAAGVPGAMPGGRLRGVTALRRAAA